MGFLFYPNSSSQEEVTHFKAIQDDEATASVEVTATNEKAVIVTHNGIPIELLNGTDKFNLEIYDQDFSSYNNNANYSVEGYFKASEFNVLNLKIKIRLYNAKGQLINEMTDDALKKDYHPIARSGDYIPFHVNSYETYINKPPLAKVTVEILAEETETPPDSYESSDTVKVAYEPKRPKNVQITVLERKNLQSFNKYSNAIKQKNTFEISNTGNVVLKQMKGRVDWYKNDGTKYSSSSKDLLYNFLQV